QNAAVFVGFLLFRCWRAEGGGFDDFLAEYNVYQLKAPANDAGAAEQRADLVGCGIGRHVEILGGQADDKVAHGAAHDVSVVAMLIQNLAHLDRVTRNLALVDAVLLACQAQWAARRGEQAVDQCFYSAFHWCLMTLRRAVRRTAARWSSHVRGRFAPARRWDWWQRDG